MGSRGGGSKGFKVRKAAGEGNGRIQRLTLDLSGGHALTAEQQVFGYLSERKGSGGYMARGGKGG